MRRREFITLLGGAAATWPLAARAQQPAMPVIGFLGSGISKGYREFVAAFHQGLRETGHVEGRNIAIEYRWADGHYDRLPALAAELVNRPVAVIAAGALPAALAAKAATSSIPIVFMMGSDAIKFGLVASLNRPGGNVTGAALLNNLLQAKQLEFLHEAVPTAASAALLVNPDNPNAEVDTKEAQAAARVLGLKLLVLNVRSESELDSAFPTLIQQGAGAVFVNPDPFFTSRPDKLAALTARHKIPAIHYLREFASAGGLASYITSFADGYHQAGIYAGRILKGEKPADLPVVQSTKVELVINLKAAKALGLTLPTSILVRADEVIE
jgi:putative tryptophan/tyrosine transport system substrate-binding protein